MTQAEGPSREELERAAKVAAELASEPLAELVADVLGRQAEGGSLFTGKKFVSGRVKEHGVDRASAETALGNALTALERGPSTGPEWALLSALFVRGFAQAVKAKPAERAALCAKFAGQCDWLELESPYRVLALVPRLLEPALAAEVYVALGELVLRDDDERSAPRARARNAGRIAALAEAPLSATRTPLERIEQQAKDGWSRSAAGHALGRALPAGAGGAGADAAVRGAVARYPRGGVASVLGWVSGVTLLRFALRGLLTVVGYAGEAEVELCGDALKVRKRARLLGRVVRSSEQVHPLSRLRFARRAARYPALRFVLGAFCFAAGLLIGGLFAFDALRVGDPALALFAVVALLTGTALDLIFEVVMPGRKGKVAIDLLLEQRERVRIAGVPLSEADALLAALSRKLSGARKTDGESRNSNRAVA